jgi:hypothetical protein
MNPKILTSLTLAALLAAPAFAHDAACPPSGDQLLRQMSDKLAAAHSLTFMAHREIDPALVENSAVADYARIEASVLRPNKFAAFASTSKGVRHFYADGRTLSLHDERAHTYATVPMQTSIDGLVAALDEKYGFTPPLAEFAVSNPYRSLHAQAQTVSYVGREKIAAGMLGLRGIECHHLALRGKVADAELWIAVGDSLPRKLVATFRRAGHPQVRIEFTSWNLNAPVKASAFAFTPPKGAEKIEMWTPEKMAAASKTVAARKN